MPGLFTITFPDLPSTVQAAIAIDDDMASLLQDNGYDPSKINTVSWPAVGASQHCSALFLVHNKTLDALNSASEGNTPIRLNFGGLIFDRMYLRAPRPLLPGNLSSSNAVHLYLVELADERFFWGQQTINAETGGSEGNEPALFKHGINMTVPGKRDELIYQSTMQGSPWSTFTIMDEILNNGFEYWHIDSDDWELDFDGLNNFEDIQDMHLTGQPVGNFIDFLATVSGGVVLAYPNSVDGKRYRIVPIGGSHDQNVVINTVQPYTSPGIQFPGFDGSRLKTGGFYPFLGENQAAGSSIGTVPYSTIRDEVPTGVAVYFPKVVDGLNYTNDVTNADFDPSFPFPEPGRYSYSTDRWKVIFSESNRPSPNNGDKWISVFTHQHAIFQVEGQEDLEGEPVFTEEWTNQSSCEFHAERTASHYYRRFYCMPCDATWVGIIGNPDDPQTSEVAIWSGSQVITWSYTSDGPMTHIQGDYNHPLFGFQRDKPITQMDLMSSGVIRTMPSISGGVHIDAPGKDFLIDMYLGKITTIYGPDEGWDIIGYSAQAYSDPSIKVDNIVPERMHDVSQVDINPAEIDQVCIIGVIPPAEEGSRTPPNNVVVPEQQDSGIVHAYEYPDIPSELLKAPGANFPDSAIDSVLGGVLGGVEISPKEQSGMAVLSKGNYGNVRKSRYTRTRGSDPTQPDYVLFVWETPKTVACNAEPPPGIRGRVIEGFFESAVSRMHGF